MRIDGEISDKALARLLSLEDLTDSECEKINALAPGESIRLTGMVGRFCRSADNGKLDYKSKVDLIR